MKPSITKLTTTTQTPVFPKKLHRMRPGSEAVAPAEITKKPAKASSQSRDTREDRGTREMKTSQNARSFPHAR